MVVSIARFPRDASLRDVPSRGRFFLNSISLIRFLRQRLDTLRLSGQNVPGPACSAPSHTLIWNNPVLPRSGAVERSPGYVQFINAGLLGANQATSEGLRVASVSVALIVLPERMGPVRFRQIDKDPRLSLGYALTEI